MGSVAFRCVSVRYFYSQRMCSPLNLCTYKPSYSTPVCKGEGRRDSSAERTRRDGMMLVCTDWHRGSELNCILRLSQAAGYGAINADAQCQMIAQRNQLGVTTEYWQLVVEAHWQQETAEPHAARTPKLRGRALGRASILHSKQILAK
jgi:hypothetical protein